MCQVRIVIRNDKAWITKAISKGERFLNSSFRNFCQHVKLSQLKIRRSNFFSLLRIFLTNFKASSSYTIWRQRLKKIIIIKSASFRVIRERYFERAWSLASVWKRTYKGEESQPLSTIRGTNAGCPMPRARVAAIDERIQDSSRMPISSTWLAWKSKRCNPFKRVSRWATTLSLMSNWRKTSKRRKDRAPSWLSEGGIRFFFFIKPPQKIVIVVDDTFIDAFIINLIRSWKIFEFEFCNGTLLNVRIIIVLW